MRSTRIGRPTRSRAPYRSLICAILDRAYRDALDGEPVEWEAIPWTEHVDVSIPAIKHEANA